MEPADIHYYVRKRLESGPCDNMTLSKELSLDPEYLEKLLWNSHDHMIDFCPVKSTDNNIMWELTSLD